MSQGTNPERISQNNELLIANNQELAELKEIANALPQVINTDDATATAYDIVINKTAYVKGEKITGNVITLDQLADTSISPIEVSVGEDNGLVNYMTTINEPFICEQDKLLVLQAEPAVVANAIGLEADKIAAGSTILGIQGTASGLDTSDATATARDIIAPKTAYANGEKITGIVETLSELKKYNCVVAQEENYIKFTTLNEATTVLGKAASIECLAEPINIANAIGLVSGQIVEGNTILGVNGTATILDTSITEIWDTTNNDIQVGASGIDLLADRGVISLSSGIKGNITNKDQLLISGTGNIMIETSIHDSGCLCAKLNSIEALNTYMATDGEIVVIVDDNAVYLGTYQYSAGAWSEIVSDSAYQNTLTETEYDEAVATSEEILGEDGV